MVNVLVADRNFIQFDFFRKRFILERFSQGRCDKVNFQPGDSSKTFQHSSIDSPRSPTQRRELVVEHQQSHYRIPGARRKTYIGRRWASSKIRPTYSPITPNVISWIPARKKMETMRLA